MKNAKKEKHHWVPLEQRYAPLFRDGQSVLYRNGDHPSRFDGHFIPMRSLVNFPMEDVSLSLSKATRLEWSLTLDLVCGIVHSTNQSLIF